jgi:hypothetical protein
MKSLVIAYWYGRLGNNIIQLKNVLHIALYCNYNVIIPHHPYFKYRELNIVQNTENTPIEHIYGYECSQFYGNYSLVNNECYSMNNEKVREILMDIFAIDYKTLEPLGEDELVIHIRSGDIIVNELHGHYLIPPMSYYTNYIENNQYKKIYILAENTHNTCIEMLKNKYENIDFELRDLNTDICLVLRARNIMMTVGSFIPSLMLVTTNTKNIIYPHYDAFVWRLVPLKEISSELNLNCIDLTEYYDLVQRSNDTLQTRLQRAISM